MKLRRPTEEEEREMFDGVPEGKASPEQIAAVVAIVKRIDAGEDFHPVSILREMSKADRRDLYDAASKVDEVSGDVEHFREWVNSLPREPLSPEDQARFDEAKARFEDPKTWGRVVGTDPVFDAFEKSADDDSRPITDEQREKRQRGLEDLKAGRLVEDKP